MSEKEFIIKVDSFGKLIALRKALFALKYYDKERNGDQLLEIVTSPYYNELLEEVSEIAVNELKKQGLVNDYKKEPIEEWPEHLNVIKAIIKAKENFHDLPEVTQQRLIKELASPFEISLETINGLLNGNDKSNSL